MTWYSGLEEICRPDVPLRDFTWYHLGGSARWFFTPRSEQQLRDLLARCRGHGVPWRVLGRGANILVRDQGFDGAVIHLRTPPWIPRSDPAALSEFEQVTYDGPLLAAGAGAEFTRLVRQACNRGLGGLEALAGIPGTLGGIVRMNAGGRYGEIREFVRSVRVLDAAGQVRELTPAQVGFSYRHTALDGCIVLGAALELRPADAAALTARYREIWNNKFATQPPVSERSAGCIFKNPPGQSAGALIDQSGLKGARRGGAEISRKHANFIVAAEGATAQDVLDLIAHAQERVQAEKGVLLEREVEVW